MRSTADANGSLGIYIADEALTEPGNVLEGNTVRANGSDGIAVAKGGHAVLANIARGNSGWGIDAAIGSTDGGFNVATANGQPGQCLGVVCRAEWTPPETSIDAAPDATTTRRDATFTFSANESGSTFECSLDRTPFRACSPPRRYTGLGTGPHTFRVRATDRAGNTDPSPARHAWTVRPT